MAGNKVYVQGNYVDIHDNKVVNLSIDKVGTVHVQGNVQSTGDIPGKLRCPEAEELMEDLVDAGLLTEDWQPKGLSGSERGLLAREVCTSLGINDVWQVFGKLWNEKPETLRSHLNKALDQKKSLLFQDKLKNILS